MKQWLPILLGVPMFKGIRIHASNVVKDRGDVVWLTVKWKVADGQVESQESMSRRAMLSFSGM